MCFALSIDFTNRERIHRTCPYTRPALRWIGQLGCTAMILLVLGFHPVQADATRIEQLPATARFAVSGAMGEHQNAYHLHRAGDRWQADNPRRGLHGEFNRQGATLGRGKARWRLRLDGLGYGASQTLAATEPEAGNTPNSLIYRHKTAIEWYVNGPLGLQHGVTLTQPPAMPRVYVHRPELMVRLHLDLARISRIEKEVVTIQPDRGDAWRYGDLMVYDANGKRLPARFEGKDHARQICIAIDDRQALYPLTIDPLLSQQAYLKASNTGVDDRFGLSVAISGNTLVVGANGEASTSVGVGGIQNNNSAFYSGAVYVFVRTGSVWTQQAYLKASNTWAGNQFGWSVAISGDTIVVGAPDEKSNATGVNGIPTNSATGSGAAYVFYRSSGNWTQQAYLKASNTGAYDKFGTSVTISGDTIVVGAGFEDSNATGVNGSQGNNSAGNDSGAAYVFHRSGSNWTQQAYLKASNTGAEDYFGLSVAISGDTIVVGAPGEKSNATDVNGNQSNNSAADSGAVYVFKRTGSVWTQQAYLKASNTGAGNQFGWSVAISGDTIVVGAPGEESNATDVNGNQSNNSAADSGAAYVFHYAYSIFLSTYYWSQQAYLKASNTEAYDKFGTSVTISGDTIVVGARYEDSNATGVNGSNQADNSATDSGAAYVFKRTWSGSIFFLTGTWAQQAYLKAPNTGVEDYFGLSVAISGDTIVAGAPYEDSNATGVNGNQADNSALSSGAAYVFTPKKCHFFVIPLKNHKSVSFCL